MLILDSVSRSFGVGEHRRCVLDRVSVSIAAGTETAVIGRSGSGKSTLLNLISGIDQPDAGQITFEGVNLSAMREPERTLFRRRRVGFVYQFFNLLPTLDVEENVRLVLSLDGVGTAPARRRSQVMLQRVGLGDRLHAPVDVLSGGEQQRVALPARWCTNHRCCWPMSRPAISMKSRPRRSRRCCANSPASAARR